MNKDYSGIDDAEIVPGQPVTSSLVTRLRDDALAMCQNDPAAAAAGLVGNFVPRTAYFSLPGSESFVVPDGVHRIRLTIVGGGGGGEGSNGDNGVSGSNSSVTTVTNTYTAQGGGGGGTGAAAASTVGIPLFNGLSIIGGTGSGLGSDNSGGSSQFSGGGKSRGGDAPGFGGGGGGGYVGATEYDETADVGAGGAAGATAYVANISVTPGDSISVTVGAGGAGGTSGDDGGSGSTGLVIIEY